MIPPDVHIKSDFESLPLRYVVPVETPLFVPPAITGGRPLESVEYPWLPGETRLMDRGYRDTAEKDGVEITVFVPLYRVEIEPDGTVNYFAYVSRKQYHAYIHAADGVSGLPQELRTTDQARLDLLHQAVKGGAEMYDAISQLWQLRDYVHSVLKSEVELIKAVTTLAADKKDLKDVQGYEWQLLAEYLGFGTEVLG